MRMNKTLLSYLLIVGIIGIAGASGGIILKRTMGPIEEVYPPGFSPDEYRDDVQGLYAQYLEKGITREMTNSDIVNIGLEKYKRCENCYSIGIGVANAMGVGQTVRNAQIKVGDEYFEESISFSSMVSLADRAIQHGVDGNIDYMHTDDCSVETGNYPSSYTPMSKGDYKTRFGKSLDEMFIYIISNKTVVSSKKEETSNEIKITLDLDNSISTYYYKIQMQNISGLSSLPPFTQVHHVYTFTKDLYLKSLHLEEKYTATKASIPVPAPVDADITYYYHANEETNIPKYNEPIIYKV